MNPRCLSLLLFFLANFANAQTLQFAQLGDFKLESGEVIRDCRIGYRTFGTLNSNQSNAVLFPTWALGTTEQLIGNIGSNKLVDSTKYFVIAVDALANGVSSSPSNSQLQPRMKFPKITIRDMVNTQHELLTKTLHLNHVRAVMGISMGGMQTFQWIVSYPDFMDKAIPIVGSPRPTPYDLVFIRAQLRAITNDPDWNNGNYTNNPARVAEAEFFALILTTPDEYNHHMTRERFAEELDKARNTLGFDSNDKIRQLQAIMALDISTSFGGSMERAAAAVKAKLLVISAVKDRAVNPVPALDFARLLHAQTLVLESDCGHLSPGCESQVVNQLVGDFLGQ
ncbi:MAG TPA: alpha/beta hydrolase [Verrucomicrobiae bacterium]|nr:alpha/beta hydrolase [Verrucomicrobiae bacterium]